MTWYWNPRIPARYGHLQMKNFNEISWHSITMERWQDTWEQKEHWSWLVKSIGGRILWTLPNDMSKDVIHVHGTRIGIRSPEDYCSCFLSLMALGSGPNPISL